MAVYVAFLRGINVGSKHRVNMAELTVRCEALGLSRVQTYIQSGNVVFEAEQGEAELRSLLETGLEAHFGFPIPVVLRTAAELDAILKGCPFSEAAVRAAEAASGVESLYLFLLQEAPAPEGVTSLQPFRNPTDGCSIRGREVYLLFHNSIRNSKLAANLHRLGGSGTIRNWKTMSKLDALGGART
ncbi:MAG TPA: DUF1697 domain-containing protein [Bacillota bacterium]|nr:DUF1697 domain-containing protein [Bacillota bacterium]